MNGRPLLSVIVDMPDAPSSTFGGLPSDADAAVGELYLRHARALHDYVERLCPDPASADDIMQETFIRAWHHLPRLRAEDRPIRPWLLRVARNLLIDAAGPRGHDRSPRAASLPSKAAPTAGWTGCWTGSLLPARSGNCRLPTEGCWWRPSTATAPWR